MWQGMTNYRAMPGVDHEGVVKAIPRRVADGVDRFIAAYATPAAPAVEPQRVFDDHGTGWAVLR